jgi:hypothetical protein
MGKQRRLASVAGVLAALVALAWLCLSRSDELARALAAVPVSAFALVAGLHGLTLVARSEAWRISLAAVDDRVPPRSAVHGANAAAFLVGAVDCHGALPTRIVLLRRLVPACAPRASQIAVADVPIFLLEVCTTALMLAVATAAGPLLLALALLAVLAGRRACQRFAHRPLARGLGVLADPRRRAGLAAWVALITALALARTLIALRASGLEAGVTDVALTCAAMGALGLLPLGPSAPAAATMAAAGPGAGALAAGLVVAAGSLVAVAGYALVVAGMLAAQCRLRRDEGASVGAVRETPRAWRGGPPWPRRSAGRWRRSGSTSSSA